MEQTLGLPRQHLVGHPLEGLTQHYEPPLGCPRSEMKVAQPPAPAAMPPLRCKHNEVEGQSTLYLEPAPASPACLVGGARRLDHDAFVAKLKRLLQKSSRLTGVIHNYSGNDQ